jgi:hypothetical protein
VQTSSLQYSGWRSGQRWTRHTIEATWLALLALVPLAITHQDWIDANAQVPRVFVLRTLTLVLLAALATDLALTLARTPGALLDWRASLTRHPARLAIIAIGVITYATVLATALSPVPQIAIAGVDAGRSSGSLATFASYLVALIAVATHLRTRAQLTRLLWVIVGSAWLVSVYGIGQHFGLDPLRTDAHPVTRITLTFGNSIFASALLTMTIPLSLALAANLRGALAANLRGALAAGLRERATQLLVAVALVAPQLAAVAFTLTRGAWLAVAFASLAFVIVIGWSTGRRAATAAGLVLAGSLAITLLLITLPVAGSSQSTAAVASRLATIPDAVSLEGGLSKRYAIWGTTLTAILTTPWPEDPGQNGIPSLSLRTLRPLIGYGPDTYAHIYPLPGDTLDGGRAEYAHNFLLHAAVEIGILGAAAYAALIVALALALFRMLNHARQTREEGWRLPLLAGLAAALVGRSVEQLVGVAQPTDLLLSWVLAGVIIALASPRFDQPQLDSPAPSISARAISRTRISATLASAGVIALVLIVGWYQIVFEDARAARLAAQARTAADASDATRADQLLLDAIALSPGASVTRLSLADRLYDRATSDPALSPLAQAEALAAAFAQTSAVLARNPLDARAWSRSIRINATLDAILEGPFAQNALDDALTLAALYPGYWQPQHEIAATRLLIPDPAGALDAIAQAKALGATGPGIFFTEALALLATGQRAAARAIADRLAFNTTPQARAMHAELLRNLSAEQ